jgi:hypothetical protein
MAKGVYKLILLSAFVFCPAAPCASMQVNLTRNGDPIEILIGARGRTHGRFDQRAKQVTVKTPASAETKLLMGANR